ncbi:hypothetical protein [Marivivens marinus]|uniref:hypothetical protein n=1 Tax=Marivivens marinus TaxID=3110173 RepID=UPI003B84A104
MTLNSDSAVRARIFAHSAHFSLTLMNALGDLPTWKSSQQNDALMSVQWAYD